MLSLLVACSEADDDVAVTTTATTLAPTTTTTERVGDAWAEVRSPDTSCFVVVTSNGDLVVDHNADVPVIPASVLKLLVADASPDDARVPAILRHSDNDAARALVDELGGPDAVEQTLLDRDRPMAGVDVRDATGHDRANRVTCRLLVAILTGAPDSIRDALAVAGEPGTMQERYTGAAGRLRGKTGSIRGVASLAGYLDDLTFAAVVNGDAPEASLDALVEGLLR